jgi:PadR family transcriptional regulator, regulatory protein PadR
VICTPALLSIAEVLLQQPGERHWGYDLSRQTQVKSGSLYPILRRMLAAGWLSDGWEDPMLVQGRPPRRFYVLTTPGYHALHDAVRASSPPDPAAGARG